MLTAQWRGLCYTANMTSRDLKTFLTRVPVWPKGAQDEAVKALREIEEDFIIGPATRQELDHSHQEALRGEGVSLEDIKERLGI
jgi:hypothetical protein